VVDLPLRIGVICFAIFSGESN